MNNKNKLFIVLSIIVVICVILMVFLLNQKHDIYKFDFSDGYEPGSTYKGEIDLTSGKVDYKIIYGCSLPNRDECPDDDIVKGTLNKTQLELVKKAIEENNQKYDHLLLKGISYLIKGDIICDEETKETCEDIGKQLIKR